ncbi:MAG TPA: prolipoprotein diacylglyceryl transferase [Vicinamibacterales bacterium]|nr:prolipoprotein diacylglyceryl transferase [Vicinamibacterales bacterium]
MHPILFESGGLTLYTYGVLLAAAYLVGLQFAVARARRRGLDPQRVLDLGIWIIVAALLGAKLLLLAIYPRQYASAGLGGLLDLARSGGVFYGGLLAAVGAAIWYVRRHRLALWSTADVFAPAIALGHGVGRLGCLLAGCCYGRPTTVPWAVTFHSQVAHANVGTPLGIALHPTQLYESGAELVILAILLTRERRGRQFPGRTFWTYVLLYGIARFVIEFYRGDNRGTVFSVLSTSQFISAILVPLAIVMLFALGRTPSPAPAETAQARAV